MADISDSFDARASDGTVYRVLEIQHYVQSRTLGGSHRAKGSVEYVLDDGSHVNPNDDGTFSIVKNDGVLTRI